MFEFKEINCDPKGNGQRIEVSIRASSRDTQMVIEEFCEVMANIKHIEAQDYEMRRQKLEIHLGEEGFRATAQDYLLNRFTVAALHQLDYDTVLSPGVHTESYPEKGKDFSFTISITLRPFMTLSSIEPVIIKQNQITIEEKDIIEQINYTAQQFSEFTIIEKPELQEGDFALLDVEMVKNGKPDKELSGVQRLVEVKHELLPSGFLEGLLGLRSGETKRIEFTIEKNSFQNASEDMALAIDNYSASVRLCEIQEKNIPIIDDNWVAENLPQFGSLEAFREHIKGDLERQRKKVEQQDIVYQVRSALEKRLEGSIPDERYHEAKDSFMLSIIEKLDRQGTTLDQYLKDHGIQKDSFSVTTFMQAAEYLRQNLALDVLAQRRGFIETETEIQQAKRAFGPAISSLSDKEFEERGLKKSLAEQIRREKAMKWLMETVVIED